MPKGPTVGLFIKEYLQEYGPASAYDIWKAWAEVRERAGYKVPSYYSFWQNYIWRLKKMGLIREVRKVGGRGRFPRVLLAVVPERVEDPAWLSVQAAYREFRKGG